MAIGLFKFIKGLVIKNDSDITKELQIEVASGATTGTKTTLQASQTTNRTLTLPDATDTLTANAATQTLTNKTLTGNTAANLVSGSGTLTLPTSGTVTVPNGTDTLVSLTGTQTLTNKTLTSPTINTPTGITKSDVGLGNVDNTSDATKNAAAVSLTNKTISGSTNTISIHDANFTIQDNTDDTKQVQFQVSGVTTGTTRTLTVPDANTTLVGTDATQTLTNKTLTSPVISSISNTGTLTLPTSTDTLVGRATTDTLTNKTISGSTNTVTVHDTNFTIQDNADNTKQLKIEASSITTGTTRTLTAPDANTTIVGTDATQTLTNKTINASNNTVTNVSLTTAVTGTLPIANGGTNNTSIASAGAAAFSDGSKINYTAVGSSGQYLQSAGSGTPTWQTITTPNRTVSTSITNAVSPYTVLSTDDFIRVNAAGGTVTLNLPTASGISGKQYCIKKTDSSANVVTIDPNGSETVDGSSTATLSTQYETITIVSDGTNWLLLERHIDESISSTTPTVSNLGSGGVSAATHRYFRQGREVVIYGSFTKDGTNGTGSSAITVTLPFTADTTSMNSSSQTIGGGYQSNGTTMRWRLNTSTDMTALNDNGNTVVGSDAAAGRIFYWQIRYIVNGWNC